MRKTLSRNYTFLNAGYRKRLRISRIKLKFHRSFNYILMGKTMILSLTVVALEIKNDLRRKSSCGFRSSALTKYLFHKNDERLPLYRCETGKQSIETMFLKLLKQSIVTKIQLDFCNQRKRSKTRICF